MKRSRLKNIINKSKELSNPIGAFDKFKKSLPIEVDDNYRLESAWKAYGSPKDYKEALWQGLIQPIDENTYKLPSIGYNEETDEYEYLNKGRENETVDKDIRVWDNDVIPLVQELKQGGFIRVYDEEKDCWKYSKNKPQETLNEELINSFLLGGIFDKGVWTDYAFVVPDTEFVRDGKWDNYVKSWVEYFKLHPDDKRKHHTLTSENGLLQFRIPMTRDEIKAMTKKVDLKPDPIVELPSSLYVSKKPEYFLKGGLMNVIPEGALHARKNNMEGAGEDFTHKGIPVMDNNGLQQAEIERNEVIFNKEVTDFIEENYKKFKSEETSNSEKDEIAIKVGKRLVKELLENTQDNTGLIQEVLEKM